MNHDDKDIKGTIPQVEQLKEAVLEVLKSGRSRTFESLERDVASHFDLTSKQRNYRVGKSKTALFSNRLGKARSELRRAQLIEYPSPGKVKLAMAAKPSRSKLLPEKKEVAQSKPQHTALPSDFSSVISSSTQIASDKSDSTSKRSEYLKR